MPDITIYSKEDPTKTTTILSSTWEKFKDTSYRLWTDISPVVSPTPTPTPTPTPIPTPTPTPTPAPIPTIEEPTVQAAITGQQQYGDVLTLAGGQKISPQDPNYATYAKQLGITQPITAPTVADLSQPVSPESLYIGATNWATLQKQYPPAQLEAATELRDGKRYWKSDVNISNISPSGKPITAESLGGAAAITLPGAPAGAAGTTATITGTQTSKTIDDYIKANTPTPTAEETQAGSLTKQLMGLIPETAGQAAMLAEEYAKPGGVKELNASLTNVNSQIQTAVAEREALRVEQQGKPVTMATIIGAQAQINAVYDSKILTLTAQANGLMGNIALAKDNAQAAVDAKYAPKLEAIKILEAQLAALQPTLTAQEKIRADAQTQMLADQKQAIADAKTEENNIQNIMLQAAQNGADANLLSIISNSKTILEATQNAGQFLVSGDWAYVKTPAERDALIAQGYEIM